MLKTPQVTVLMAVYNGERYVEAAIESILIQNWTDFELIIVNDDSTDGTAHILSEAARRDTRIRLITLPENRGLATALNVGLREARGIYVVRQDVDDLSLPNRLGVQVRLLENRPQIHMVGSMVENIDESGKRLGLRRNKPTDWTAIRWGLLFANQFIHSSVLARRESLMAVGGYDESFTTSQDYDLWSRMAQNYELTIIPKVLVQYRCHSNQVGVRHFEAQIRNSASISARNLSGVGVTLDPRTATSVHRVYGNARDATPRDVVLAASVLPKVLRAFVRRHGLQVGDRNRLRRQVVREILRALRNVPRAVVETPLAGLVAALRLVTVVFRLPSNMYLLKPIGAALLRRFGLCRLESTSCDGSEAVDIP